MIRRPPRSTRTDTLFPYTTLCRSRLETVNQEDCFVQLEELKPGLRIDGLIPAEVITVIAAQWHGTDALELTYKNTAGALGQQVVFRKDQDKLAIAQSGSRAFDANASDFKLVAEAQRITLAGLFDPMLEIGRAHV